MRDRKNVLRGEVGERDHDENDATARFVESKSTDSRHRDSITRPQATST
jgi:hypothetical protein